jgi:hypothetical protein
MGDRVKVCGKGVLKDSALDGCFTSSLGPEFVGGITVGSTARGSEYNYPPRVKYSLVDESTILITSKDCTSSALAGSDQSTYGYSLKMRPVSIVSSDGYQRRVDLEEC